MQNIERIDPYTFTKQHTEWSVIDDGTAITRSFPFSVYKSGVEQLERIVAYANEVDHHPDITIHYNLISVVLTTHDTGGVTERDTQFAHMLDKLFADA